MAQMSDYLQNQLINGVFRNITYLPAADLYVALYSTDPTEADTGTELTGSGYARIIVTFDAPAIGSGTSQNTDDITFPTATADWVEITHIGIRDATGGGNLLAFQALSTPVTVLNTNNFRIPSQQLTVIMT